MTRYQLCDWLRNEFRRINPRELQTATHLLVKLGTQCKEPEEFKRVFAAAGFDKTPTVPRVDPELWPERPVDAQWGSADPEEPYERICGEVSEAVVASINGKQESEHDTKWEETVHG